MARCRLQPTADTLEALFEEYRPLIDTVIWQNWALIVATHQDRDDVWQELAIVLWKALGTLDSTKTDNVPRYLCFKMRFGLLNITRASRVYGIAKAPPKARFRFVYIDAPDRFGNPLELPVPAERPAGPLERALATLGEKERDLVEQLMDGRSIKAPEDKRILEATLAKLRGMFTDQRSDYFLGVAS